MDDTIFILRKIKTATGALGIVLVLLLFSDTINAKTSKGAAKAQWAYVLVDGAAVYQYPNFDSPILDYLRFNKKVRVSTKLYPGIGGLGAFYKIRIRPGVFGYITDVDAELKSQRTKKEILKAQNGGDDASEDNSGENTDEVYFRKMVGLSFRQATYAEKIGGKVESSPTTFLGVRHSGPTGLMGGFPLDIDFIISPSAPDFYNSYFEKPSGILLSLSAQIMMPMMNWATGLTYYAFGFQTVYSSFKVTPFAYSAEEPIDSSELRAGLLGSVGMVQKVGGNWYLRVDGAYHMDKEKYLSLGLSLQYSY